MTLIQDSGNAVFVPAAREPASPPSTATETQVEARGTVRRARWLTVGLVAALVGLVTLLVSPKIDAGEGGLIASAPTVWLVACIVIAGCLALEIHRSERAQWTPWLLVVALTVLLAVAPTLLEADPRFAATYTHIGFIDYISRTGHTLPDYDARFNWPGFFTFGAVIEKLTGVNGLIGIVRWWPLAIDLILLVPVRVLAQRMLVSERRAWVGVALFVLGNWIGQDYFSPQSVNYVLYLVVIGFLLSWLGDRRPAGRVARLLRLGIPDDAGDATATALWSGRADRVFVQRGVLVMVAMVAAASVVSHQLTPIGLASAAGVLVLCQLLVARRLPWVIGGMVLIYLCYFAEPYWTGHLGTVFGAIGHLHGTVSSGVGQRAVGDPAHVFAAETRIGVALIFLLLGIAGTFMARRGGASPALPLLVVSAVLVAFVQAYGGEVVLRVFLYALPFLALLGARALPTGRFAGPVLAVVLCALVPLHLVARFGNEGSEQTRPDELAAVSWMYDNTPTGSVLIGAVGASPLGFAQIESHRFDQILPTDLGTPAVMGEVSYHEAPSYVLLTRGEQLYGQSNFSLPSDWTKELQAYLVDHGGTVVFSRPEATVIRIGPFPGVIK